MRTVNCKSIADHKPSPKGRTGGKLIIAKQLPLAKVTPNGAKSEDFGGTHMIVSHMELAHTKSTKALSEIGHNIVNIVPITLKSQL